MVITCYLTSMGLVLLSAFLFFRTKNAIAIKLIMTQFAAVAIWKIYNPIDGALGSVYIFNVGFSSPGLLLLYLLSLLNAMFVFYAVSVGKKVI